MMTRALHLCLFLIVVEGRNHIHPGTVAFRRHLHSDSSSSSLNHLSSISRASLDNLRGGSSPLPSSNDDEEEPNVLSEVLTSNPETSSGISTTETVDTTTAVGTESSSTTISSKPKQSSISNPKLQNAIERTGPALLLLAALYMFLKLTGEKGLYTLVPLMQLGMYSETTNIIETFHGGSKKNFDLELHVEKWWWFLTIFLSTTGRFIFSSGVLNGFDIFNNLSMNVFNLICFGMVALGLVVAVVGMASHDAASAESFRLYLGEVAAFHFALIFLVGQSSFWIKTIESFGMFWVLYPALLVVVNDTMAYVFGVLLGKHKLLPRLSPKKTVEGFVGAGLSTIGIAIPLLKYFNQALGNDGKFKLALGGGKDSIKKHAVVMALYVSLVSPFGGFLASAVKRAHGAKDFGALIPGHGGVVDRFDCQVVTAPFVYLYLKSCIGE